MRARAFARSDFILLQCLSAGDKLCLYVIPRGFCDLSAPTQPDTPNPPTPQPPIFHLWTQEANVGNCKFLPL